MCVHTRDIHACTPATHRLHVVVIYPRVPPRNQHTAACLPLLGSFHMCMLFYHLHTAILLHTCVLHVSASYTSLRSFGLTQDPSRRPVHSCVPMPHPDLLAACLDLPPSLSNTSRALTVYQAPCLMLGTLVGGGGGDRCHRPGLETRQTQLRM